MISHRITDPALIEHRLLELAYTTDAALTPSVLAYFAPCSIDDAERVFDDLTARERLRMDVDDSGTVTYTMPDRQKLGPRVEPTLRPATMMVPVRHVAIRGPRHASPGLAALLSLFVPGAGQLYTGRAVAGLLWFLVVTAGYALILPGLILHVFNIASSAASAHQLNAMNAYRQLRAG